MKFVFNVFFLLLLIPSKMEGQKFFAGFECSSGNLESSFLGIPTQLLNCALMEAMGDDYDSEEDGQLPGYSFTVRFNTIKNGGQKVDYEGYNFLGFRAKDLFRDFEYSAKVGWQPAQIPVGLYLRIGFRHENFETRLNEDDSWTKHRLNCLRPGVGIRISPFENLLEEMSICPIIELGSCYDYYVSYRGAYGDEIKQLNNGLSTQIGIGIKGRAGDSLILSFDNEHYNLFNNDFEVNGIKPYADITTNHFNISLSITLGL